MTRRRLAILDLEARVLARELRRRAGNAHEPSRWRDSAPVRSPRRRALQLELELEPKGER